MSYGHLTTMTLLLTVGQNAGKLVFLPFRMSCFVISNLIVTLSLLTPGLGVNIYTGTPTIANMARHSGLSPGRS